MLRPLFTGVREFMAQQEQAGHTCTIVRQGEPEESLPTEPGYFDRAVHLVESDALEVRDTGFRGGEDSGTSEFRFFLDGVQYSHLVSYVDNVPLVHHLSAAAILARDPETRQLRLWRWSGVCERLLVPKSYVDYDLLMSLGVPVADTMDESKDAPREAVALRALAHSKSQRMRRHIEVGMIRQWVEAAEAGWLMVDGPLMLLPELNERARMVGVVKSFGAQFFDGEQQLRIMTLPQAHRTTAFQLPRGSRPAANAEEVASRHWYSWYVRIRDAREHDTDHGLLRVEVPPDPEMLAQADAISRWLIAERAPLSTPDPRWDNLLYPIHACEQFLRSMLPERRRVHLYLT